MNNYEFPRNRNIRAPSKKGIPKVIYAVRSCQGLTSQPIHDDDSLLESPRRVSLRRKKYGNDVLEIMAEVDSPSSVEKRRSLGKLFSTMPILKPERKLSSDSVGVHKSSAGSTKNVVFTNVEQYKNKKPNMFQHFEMASISVVEMSSGPTVNNPKKKPAMETMLSPSMPLTKPMRKASLDNAIAVMKPQPSPRRIPPLLHRASSNQVDMASPSMPLIKPMRKMKPAMETTSLLHDILPLLMNRASFNSSMPLTKPQRKASMDAALTCSSSVASSIS
jgi:hypothetical protein